MLVGCVNIFSKIRSASIHHGTEYRIKQGGFSERACVTLRGEVEGRRTSELMIGGSKSTTGMPLSTTIFLGEPTKFEAPEVEQTVPAPNGLIGEPVTQHRGWFSFGAAIKDRELEIDSPDQLFAEVYLSQPMFETVWHWVTLGCKGSTRMHIEIFGKQMRLVPSFARKFEWDVGEHGNLALYVASFAFMVSHEATGVVTDGRS